MAARSYLLISKRDAQAFLISRRCAARKIFLWRLQVDPPAAGQPATATEEKRACGAKKNLHIALAKNEH